MDNSKLFSAKLVLWIGLLLSFFIPLFIHLLNIIIKPHRYLSLFLGIGLTCLTLSLFLILKNQEKVFKAIEKKLQNLQNEEIEIIKQSIDDINLAFTHFKKSKIITIDRDNLYKKMKIKINRANRIYLTYLAKKPPNSANYTSYQSKKEYLDDLEKQILDNTKAIKRIVLYTDENKEWIKEIANNGIGKGRFSLSILKDNNLIPRVPFQIIDDKYLIILGKVPSESVIKRDIIIESKEVIETYEVFYEKLWKSNSCYQVIENGQKNEKNYNTFFN